MTGHATGVSAQQTPGASAYVPSGPAAALADCLRLDLIGARVGAGDHVLDPLDAGFGKRLAQEADLARAGLAVLASNAEDGAFVLGDEVRAIGLGLEVGEVAVLVEDPGELFHLG